MWTRTGRHQMSPFFMPHDMLPDAKEMEAGLERMTRDISGLLPKEMHGAANLMAHPLAASAAMTAFGIGIAGQAFGLWMGTMTGSMEAARRLAEAGLSRDGDDDEPAYKAPRSTRVRMRAAVETLVTDVEHAAKDIAETSARAARDIAEDTVKRAASPRGEAVAEKPAPIAKAEPAMKEAEGTDAGTSSATDDLKAISGIGPKLEQVLNDRGIRTYAQIAALTKADIAKLDEELGFKGRIERDDWLGQAVRLAGAGK